MAIEQQNQREKDMLFDGLRFLLHTRFQDPEVLKLYKYNDEEEGGLI